MGPDGAWYRASGRAASTHIFKPAPRSEDGLDVIEHVCAWTASRLGIPAASSELRSFDGERVFISRRYDRNTLPDGRVERLHQEDLLQALGRSREQKYQFQGGPTLIDLLRFTREHTPADMDTLLRLIAFNVHIGNTDAHAKNYSVLITPDGHHLAPAYDLISLIPYSQYRTDLAMPIGRAIGGERTARGGTKATARGGDATEVAPTPGPARDGTPNHGDIWVQPHVRRGRPVEGHWRRRRV